MDKITIANHPIHHPLVYFAIGYFLKVSIGTSRQEVFILLETIVKASWNGCSNQSFSNSKLGFFDPFLSSSYEDVLCDSPL